MTISTNVNVSGTWRKAANLYVKDSGSWRTIQNAYIKDGGSWRLVFQRGFTATVHIAADTQNWTVDSSSIAGWDGVVPLFLTLIVDTGVIVGSSSTGSYSMTIPSLPAGSTVNLTNNGKILGAGGDGAGVSAGAGGPALNVGYAITINNTSGVIGGGGGGGGHGGTGGPVGGGGGGQGSVGGAHGGSGGQAGTDGGPDGPGSGGVGGAGVDDNFGGDGGDGGTLGNDGSAGGGGSTGGGSSGGAAGLAINGYSNITWSGGAVNIYGATA